MGNGICEPGKGFIIQKERLFLLGQAPQQRKASEPFIGKASFIKPSIRFMNQCLLIDRELSLHLFKVVL